MSTNTGSPFNFTLPQDTDLADFVNVFLKPQLTALNTYAVHSTATQVLVNKSIADAIDNSKTLGFNLAGTAAGLSTTLVASATGTSKTITLPNLTDTLVGRTTTDTLTNKTLTSPSITSPSITSPSITSPTISSGGLTVTTGGATITGNSTITGTLGGLTGLTVASGNVGIGTTSPSYPMHIYGSVNSSDVRVFVNNVNTGSSAYSGYALGTDLVSNVSGLFLQSNANVQYGSAGTLTILQSGAYPISLATNNITRMHITSAGAIGLGTTNPAPLTTTFQSSFSPLALDGAYYGGGAYWNGSAFANRVANQGGWVIRNNSGQFTVWTGAANVTADTAISGFAERMIITSAGNVGIGTSTPTEFQVYRANAGGGLNALFENSSTVANSSAYVQVKNNVSTGYAGLSLCSDGSRYMFFQKQNGTEDARITVNNAAIYFFVTSALNEKMEINNTGVGIGGITPSYSLHLVADSAAKPTSNTWTISSDARVKEVIGSYTRGVADIMALEPKRYRLNGAFGSVDDGRVHVSVIAQEAQATWPEMIGTYDHTDKDEDDVETVTELLNLNTNELQWALVNAIKELAQRVEALEVHG